MSNIRSKNGGKAASKLAATITADAEKGLDAAALVLVTAIKGILNTPGKGRLYKRGKTKTHRASAPGQPPARDFSILHNSIDIEKSEPLTRKVGTGEEPAPMLEFGTEKMAPRPFMRPAKEAAQKQMGVAIVSELRKSTKEG